MLQKCHNAHDYSLTAVENHNIKLTQETDK